MKFIPKLDHHVHHMNLNLRQRLTAHVNLAKFHNFARTLDAAVGAGAFSPTREGLSNKPLIMKNGPGLAEIVIQRVKRGEMGRGRLVPRQRHAGQALPHRFAHSLTALLAISLRDTPALSPTPFALPYGVARPLHGHGLPRGVTPRHAPHGLRRSRTALRLPTTSTYLPAPLAVALTPSLRDARRGSPRRDDVAPPSPSMVDF